MRTTIAFKGADGSAARWRPTTLDLLGKNEAYLEAVLAEMPELFLLEATLRRISRPHVVYRQLRFSGPQERAVRPDIVLLAASGDVVIVEVKLFANQELQDRRVIAQAIDYPASLFSLSETVVQPWFGDRLDRLRALAIPGRGGSRESCRCLPEEHGGGQCAHRRRVR